MTDRIAETPLAYCKQAVNNVNMYAKLYSRITESSLMETPIRTRYVFLMMMAISDPKGYVIGTDVAIARRLNITEEELKDAIKELMEPDPDSNSKEHDGRRVIPSDGERGYKLVNYITYRNHADEDSRREYMRKYMKERRSKDKDVNSDMFTLTSVTQAEGEEDAEADGKEKAESLVVAFWNGFDSLPTARTLSGGRLRALKSRMKEPFFRSNWQAAIRKAAESDFCKGKNDRQWKADIDWFLRPDTVAKIMEGKYDNRERAYRGGGF